MKWSIPLGRWFGIPVYVHVTFVLVLGFLAVANGVARGSVAAALGGAAFFLAIFGCVLLNEFGHALAARRYGIATKDILLLPIGGLARLERMPDKPIQEFWIAVAGPAVNVVIVAVLGVWLLTVQGLEAMSGLSTTSGGFAARLLAVNVFLVVFNLLPAFPMDGGRVLRSLLALRLDYARATNLAGRLGQAMAFLFAFVGLFGNPMLLLIAFFVWFGASQEMDAAQTRSALSGVTVGEAMLTDYRVLSGQERLGEVARLVLAGSQQDFPVLEGSAVVGLLERRHLLEGLSRLGPEGEVREVMTREFPVLEPGDPVESLPARSGVSGLPMVPVVVGGRLVGLFTLENLSELLLVRAAVLSGSRGGDAAPVWRSVLARPPLLPRHT